MAGDVGESIPIKSSELGISSENASSPNFDPFLQAMDNAELPADLRQELGLSLESRSRALLHGKIHLLAERKRIPPLIETVLLSGLQTSTDQDDVDLIIHSGGKRKPFLVESNMEPWKDCKEVCWGNMPTEERQAYMDKCLHEDAQAREDNLDAERHVEEALISDLSVKDAAKRYGKDPLFLASLALEIDKQKPGWQGLRQLLDTFPPSEGFADSFKDLRRFIDAWDKAEIPEGISPWEWIDNQREAGDKTRHYFYFEPEGDK